MSVHSLHLRDAFDPVEKKAWNVQQSLWNQRFQLWRTAPPVDPIELLEPGVALRLFDFGIQSVDGLGMCADFGDQTEAAGLVDYQDRTVRVSTRYSREIQRFTAAHELGHVVLHPGEDGVLRDLPTSGPRMRRNRMEADADRFAACFLMPRRLLTREFVQLFGAAPFVLSEEVSYALAGTSTRILEQRVPNLNGRGLSLLLAGASVFNGRRFRSLSDRFGVSQQAMAIRLEEIGVVAVRRRV